VVCADTNCVIAYLAGERGDDVDFLDKLFARRVVILAPVVVAELLSDPALPYAAGKLITSLPRLATGDGYWERAGKLRAQLARRGYAARLADTLIAQSCLDHNVPLLTRDKGFQRFAKVAGLKLV
jgi:predicted nucleic acid-binding protein